MGIVALHACIDRTRRCPSARSFAVSAAAPIPNLIKMALPAKFKAGIKTDGVSRDIMKDVKITLRMTREARHEAVLGMLQLNIPVRAAYVLRLHLRQRFCMTRRTRVLGHFAQSGNDKRLSIRRNGN